MEGIWFQLALVTLLILLNAVFAGAELALVSLREGQLQRLDARGGAGAVLAGLARDPNRFLATIQIVITLSGFFASASAAVTLSQPVSDSLAFLGGAARPVAVVLVTLAISYVTLVVGELAPKRLAMQRAEGWGLMIARPLSFLSTLTRPAVWLLSVSADLVVRVLGGDPTRRTEEVTREELRDLAASLSVLSSDHRLIISGALDISERTLREIVRPRREVVVLDETTPADTAVHILREAGYSRAPVAAGGDLDQAHGVVHLRDLVDRDVPVGDLAEEPLVLPETV
ncbi:MAG: hemolysin family protein, partial [bacterium]